MHRLQLTDTRPPAVLLIGRDGHQLACTLTDGHALGLQARVDADALLRLQSAARELGGLGAPHDDVDEPRPAQRQALGRLLCADLLPEPIQRALFALPGGPLTLQLTPEMAGVPWELAFDGERHLDEVHAVGRQLVRAGAWRGAATAQPAPRDVVRVLLLGGDGGPSSGPLLDTLHAAGSVRPLVVDPSAIAPRALQALLQRHEVVHLDVDTLARLPPPEGLAAGADEGGTRLLVVHGRPQAVQALLADREGLLADWMAQGPAVLLHAAPEASADAFLQPFYTALGHGAAIGEAARVGRLLARAQGAACALTRLLGNPAGRLVKPARTLTQTDHVRQVTVLSCDLVESTRLMRELGHEAYSEHLANYHALLAQAVASHSGSSDDPQGDDGVMCYFGFPQAVENAAVQALRAGLSLLERCRAQGIAVRIGAATGQIVVKSGQPVGAAVHHAARLQALASPGTILVSEATRRLIGERFEFEDLGPAPALKGLETTGAVFRVVAESPLQGTERFDRQLQLAPFVGRDEELAWLLRQAREVADGGRALQVVGEAGIGKSRLLREFRRAAAGSASGGGSGWRFFEWRCAPEHTSTPHYAVTDFLARVLRFRDDETPEVRRDKIAQSTLAQLPMPHAAALVAQLLSVPGDAGALAGWSGERVRNATTELLLAWMWQTVEAEPVCLIVEDVHWIDPSTRALLVQAVRQVGDRRLLMILTSRPEDAPAPEEFGAHALVLNGLAPEVARRMVEGLRGSLALAPEVEERLLARADGVPLFLEESTRMVLAQTGGVAASLAVPATLHDLLMARLDRSQSAKRLAQVASALGREFPRALLVAVTQHIYCPVAVHDLDAGLATLVETDLLVPKGSDTEPAYLFRHALLRDAAYGSLWERDRRRLHGVIAEAIESALPRVAEAQPELLARHLTEAGLSGEAIAQWEHAARRATARSAHLEAAAHLHQALTLLDTLAPGTERDRIELRLQLLLAGRLIATEGYGAARVEQVYQRCLGLCRQLGDDGALVKTLFGLEGVHFMRADFERARALCDEAVAPLARVGDPVATLQAEWTGANIDFHQGDLVRAVQRLDACLARSQHLSHRPSAVQDPTVMCLCYSAWALWQLGRADEALQRAERVVERARQTRHAFSLGEAYGFLTAIHLFRGEHEAARQAVRPALEICEQGGFLVWLSHARVLHGRLLVHDGAVDAGLAAMQQGYEGWTATGAVVTRAFYLSQWAEGLAAAGRLGDALDRLAEARAIIDRCGERYFEPEVLRLSGVLGAARDADPTTTEAWLRAALRSAQSMQQLGLGLRCASSLAAHQLEHGRADTAAGLLREALAPLSEGQPTQDLRLARALLARCSAAADGPHRLASA